MSFPSIDTGMLNSNTSFNEELAGLVQHGRIDCFNGPTFFAQKRWCCGAEGLDNAIMLSDYFDHRAIMPLINRGTY